MDVSNSTATSVSALVNSPQPQPPAPQNDKQPEKQQDSTVVKLSAEAQRMNRTENRDSNAERADTGNRKAVEPPGIKFMEGKDTGGRVNTFA